MESNNINTETLQQKLSPFLAEIRNNFESDNIMHFMFF